MEAIQIYQHINKKGLGTMDLFQIIPYGKKGKSLEVELNDGSRLSYKWGDNIRDNELQIMFIVVSMFLQTVNKERIEQIKQCNLPEFDEQGRLKYQSSSISGKDISKLLCGVSRPSRIYKALQHIESLAIDYEDKYEQFRLRIIDRISWQKNSKSEINFSISNILINRVVNKILAYNLQPLIENKGLAFRLAAFIESRQRGTGNYYFDADSNKRERYVPLNIYRITAIIKALQLEDSYKANPTETVKRLSEAFREIKSNSEKREARFPSYYWNKKEQWFENEHKSYSKLKKCQVS